MIMNHEQFPTYKSLFPVQTTPTTSPVVDLCFQFRVGIDFEPLLEKKALHKKDWRIGAVSLCAFSDGVVSHKQIFDPVPVDGIVDVAHSLNGPVFFDGSKHREISECGVGFHFLEAHISSGEVDLEKAWHKTH